MSRFTFLVVLLAVLITGSGAYTATWASTVRAIDEVLLSASSRAADALGPAPDSAALDRYVRASSSLGVVVVAEVDADGRVEPGAGAAKVTVDGRDVAVARGDADERRTTVVSRDGTVFRVLVVRSAVAGRALLFARDLVTIRQILRTLALSLVVFGAATVVTAGFVSRRVAQAGVAPVRELTAEIEERAAAEDLRRVTVDRDDEIGRLGTAFNHLLDTIKVSRTRQARFVADAGHELRTPLTSMRTNIELLTADSARAMLDPSDRMTIMRDVRTQLIEFSDLVSDLIGLTREDRSAADFAEVDLTAVLDEAIDRVSMQAPGVRWDVDLEPTTLNGDPDLLGRAFANVLDNAVKFSPDRGTVTVRLRAGEVRIGDEGRGVAKEERPFVFDRFFRSEASRATPGTGLGLSITESAVRQHGGTVAVRDAPSGGALFVLTFPLAVFPHPHSGTGDPTTHDGARGPGPTEPSGHPGQVPPTNRWKIWATPGRTSRAASTSSTTPTTSESST